MGDVTSLPLPSFPFPSPSLPPFPSIPPSLFPPPLRVHFSRSHHYPPFFFPSSSNFSPLLSLVLHFLSNNCSSFVSLSSTLSAPLFVSAMCCLSPSPPLPLSLLSNNGRHLWHFVRQPFGTNGPHSLRFTDLLSNRSVLFPLIGFSSIGQPLAIYWASNENKAKDQEKGEDGGEEGARRMILLDFKAQAQDEDGGYVSQRMIQIDHSRRLALFMGPTHRQYATGSISRILRVVFGSVYCAIVGEDGAEDGEGLAASSSASATLLSVPRLPDSAAWPSEVSLRGFSTAVLANSLNALFFLGRPIANGTAEKLCFAAQNPQSGQFVAVPVCPLSASLPFRVLPIRASHALHPQQFPPSSPDSLLHFSHSGGRFAMALFRLARFGAVRWSLWRLDTFDLTWDGTLMEWEEAEGEEEQKEPAETMLSADGGVIAVAITKTDQQKGTKLIREVRCLPMPVRSSVPSLRDIVLLFLQCSPIVCPIRQASCHLAALLKMIN